MQKEVIQKVCLQWSEFIKTGYCALNRKKKNHLLSSAFYDDFLQIGIVDNRGSSSVINHYVHTFDNISNYKIERQNHPFCYPSYAYTIYKF